MIFHYYYILQQNTKNAFNNLNKFIDPTDFLRFVYRPYRFAKVFLKQMLAYDVYEGFNNQVLNKKYKKIDIENIYISYIFEKEYKDELNEDNTHDYLDYDYICDLI